MLYQIPDCVLGSVQEYMEKIGCCQLQRGIERAANEGDRRGLQEPSLADAQAFEFYREQVGVLALFRSQLPKELVLR